MRKLFLSFAALLVSSVSFGQVEKQIQFTFDTLQEYSSYKVDKTAFEQKVLKVQLRDSSSDKLVAEFLRIDDSTYFYSSFNQSGTSIAEGKAIINNLPFLTYTIPVYDSNGNELKRYVHFYNFIKTGKWYEQVSHSVSRYGNYLNNKKEGDWAYIKSDETYSGFETIIEKYKKGKLLSTSNANIFFGLSNEIIKAISGKWNVINRTQPWFMDSVVYYRRALDQETAEHYLIFNADGSCKVHTKTKITNGYWHLVNNNSMIILEIADMSVRCRFNYVSKEILIGTYSEFRMTKH